MRLRNGAKALITATRKASWRVMAPPVRMPGTLAVANTVLSGKCVDRVREFDALIDDGVRERLGKKHSARLSVGRQRTVGDVCPVMEKDEARVAESNDVQTSFESHKILPRLILRATHGHECFGALAGTEHGFLARKRRVRDAALDFHRNEFEVRERRQFRGKRGHRFAHGFDFGAASAADGDERFVSGTCHDDVKSLRGEFVTRREIPRFRFAILIGSHKTLRSG